MGALLIINYETTDLDAMETYRKKGGEELVVKGGGRPLVFTDDTLDLGEGHGAKISTVILEFDSVDDAKAAYHGEGYQSIVGERLAASNPGYAQIVETR